MKSYCLVSNRLISHKKVNNHMCVCLFHDSDTLTNNEIVVAYPRRANNPYLIKANYHQQREPIPWLGNKILRL